MKDKDIKKYDAEEAKKKVLSTVGFPDGKESLLRELSEKIIPKCKEQEKPEESEYFKEFQDKSIKYLRIIENESHVGLMESFSEHYQMLAKEMSQNIIKEFGCTNEAEKSLAKLMVNAYIRVLDNSRRLNRLLEMRDTNHTLNNYFAVLSKQIDRANRQYISALLTLKQLKAPNVEMNIKTNNAFISNNQQINVNKDENIKP